MAAPWKAPHRPNNEISQTFNDGVVRVYDGANGPDVQEPKEKALLHFAERRLGVQRYYAAKQAKDEIDLVIRVPRHGRPIQAQDTVTLNGGPERYRVEFAQAVTDAYPPCVDLTLARLRTYTVTLYNVREDPATFAREVYITFLPGVTFSGSAAASVTTGGLTGRDAATLLIPYAAAAKDALTGTPRSYAGPREYAAAEDRGGLWTLDPNADFFCFGEVVDESGDFQAINTAHDHVYRITRAALSDAGDPSLRYFDVGGA